MTVFAEIESTLVNNGFAFSTEDRWSKTYELKSRDGGWTEIVLDKEYNEVAKDVYNASRRQLSHITAPAGNNVLVARLLG